MILYAIRKVLMDATENVSLFPRYYETSNIFHINLYFGGMYILGKYIIVDKTIKIHMHKVIHYSIICNCKIFYFLNS